MSRLLVFSSKFQVALDYEQESQRARTVRSTEALTFPIRHGRIPQPYLMLPRPAKMVHKRITKHPLLPRYTPLAHHPLRRRLQGQRQHRHLPVCQVLRLVRRDGRAQGQLALDATQAGEEDRAQGEVRLDVGAGDADLEARGGRRTGGWGDEADGREQVMA